MAAPITSVVGLMSPGTWSLGYGLSLLSEVPDAPCEGIEASPVTDNQFQLMRVVATVEPAKRLPVRGSAR